MNDIGCCTPPAHWNSNGLFVTLSEPICRKVILGCPFTITYLLLIGTEVIDLLYARVPKYHFDLPFLPCATYLLDPNYLNSSVLDAVIPSYPHFFSSSSHKFTGRPTIFYYQGLTAAPAVTWLPKVASYHLLGLPLAWVGGGGTVSLHPITGPLFCLTNVIDRTTTLARLFGAA